LKTLTIKSEAGTHLPERGRTMNHAVSLAVESEAAAFTLTAGRGLDSDLYPYNAVWYPSWRQKQVSHEI
jgi:hypothetical protein